MMIYIFPIVTFYLGLQSTTIVNYLKSKYNLEKYNKIFKKIRNSTMESTNFLYRINNNCYFNFNDIYLDMSFNNDKTYVYINIYGDSSFKEILFSSYLDDYTFKIIKKEENLLIEVLLKIYENEINDVKSFGGYLYSTNIVDKQIHETISLIKKNLEIDNIVSVNISENEYFFQKKDIENTEDIISQIDIDEILEQISLNGIESLTSQQKNILNRYSADI